MAQAVQKAWRQLVPLPQLAAPTPSTLATPRASTTGFLEDFGCPELGSRARAGADTYQTQEWSTVASLPTGRVHVNVLPVTDDDAYLGFVVLLHDLSYIERREAAAPKCRGQHLKLPPTTGRYRSEQLLDRRCYVEGVPA